MREKETREVIKALLGERRYGEIAELVAQKRSHLRFLRRLLNEPGTLLCWRAVEAIGVACARLAETDPAAGRLVLRQLLWTINDESGGIGWAAPQAMGEIVYRRPDLYGDYASIIIHHAEERMLRAGVIWAAGRMAQACPDFVRPHLPLLLPYLDDPDPHVRGYLLWLLGILKEKPDFRRHGHLLHDESRVLLYEDGELKELTVAALARRAAQTA
ncbi:DVU0298 family protein [Desulfovirgula thermocuniculi]|uniref:DVU0298 family protein n=1 Tax=Desulfovirgula thermocuniculi TaxID=348842 RepID=UPI0003FFF03D|nr:DVU0298 family protein [Desulfovirgula thermocuniculi]